MTHGLTAQTTIICHKLCLLAMHWIWTLSN